MSRLAVRAKIMTELAAFATAHDVAYHSSINNYLEVNDDIWITARFGSDFADKACFSGEKIIETGTIEIIVFVKSGSSDIVAVGLCDILQDYFLTTDIDPVEVESVNSASDFAAGDASGKYYGASVDINYFHSFTI